MKNIAIGIDIGGTNTVMGITDQNGNILAEGKVLTNDFKDVNNYINELSKKIKEIIENLSEEINLLGIGIGAPNGNFYKGTIENAANLHWKGIIPFTDLLKKHFPGIPILLTNDANAAALGEKIFGAGKNMSHFVVITLGTGLGSGIIVDNKLLYGHDGFAGEIGHMNISKDGRICGCGRKGCLETYVSATGIKRTLFKLLSKETMDSSLRSINFNDLTSKMIYEAALQGDKIALKAFEITSEILGKVLADVAAVLSPEAFFLFGGLANAGKFLFEQTKEQLEKNLFSIYKNKIKILPSGLQGKNIAVLGASAMIWNDVKS